MFYSPLGRIVAWVVTRALGKAWDQMSGGDPLSPDYNFVEHEELEKDPVFPLRVVEAEVHKHVFRDLMAKVDGKLDKGFRESQMEILKAQAGRLKDGGQFQLLCNLFHSGAPTGLQIHLWGRGGGNLLFHAEGRGPAAELLFLEMRNDGLVDGSAERLVDREVRDGRFRRDEWGREWRAKLPEASGVLFGKPLTFVAEAGRPGLVGAGDVKATPLVGEILGALPALMMMAEDVLSGYDDGDMEIADVAFEPTIWLAAGVADEREWSLVVGRSDRQGPGWRLDFHGLRMRDA